MGRSKTSHTCAVNFCWHRALVYMAKLCQIGPEGVMFEHFLVGIARKLFPTLKQGCWNSESIPKKTIRKISLLGCARCAKGKHGGNVSGTGIAPSASVGA